MSRETSCIIYCRISDDREGDELGVTRQKEDCTAEAERLGFTVLDTYVENDVGASTRTAKGKLRPMYAAMIERAQAGEVQHLLAYTNSRLTRRPAELEQLIVLHEETERKYGSGKGVIIHTLKSGTDDLSTADGRMVARIKASVDTAEAERIAERVSRTFADKASKGLPAKQWRKPFGFKEDQITHDPVEAELIREAIQHILRGGTITQIRDMWEATGVLTTDGLTKWGWSRVHSALFSWRNVGLREHRPRNKPKDEAPTLHKAVWDPIISMEERDAALAMLERYSRRGEKKGRWLLTELVRCGICRGKLYGQRVDPEERSSYACNSGRTANHLAINAPKLEAFVIKAVFEYLFARAYRGVEVAMPTEVVWPKEGELADVSARINELLDAHEKGELSDRIAFPRVSKLEDQLAELEKERRVFYAATVRTVTRVEDAWQRSLVLNDTTASFEEKQLALRSEIDKVWIAKATRGAASRTDEAFQRRISIVWKEPHPEVELLSEDEWAGLTLKASDDPEMLARLWSMFSYEEDSESTT